MIRVVNNKRLEMTDTEYDMYREIVKSYTTPTNNGKDMFIDLFEVDNNGIIIFLRPPSKRQTSLEVFLFLVSLMSHQHLRLMHQQVDDVCQELKGKFAAFNNKEKDQ